MIMSSDCSLPDEDESSLCEFQIDDYQLKEHDDDQDSCDSADDDECLNLITDPPTTLKDWIFIGSTVLARWNNGLFYLGLILEINLHSEKCFIQFEDDSKHWVKFKDLHKQLSEESVMADSDILCYYCREGFSEEPNEIVICDVCNQGFHQKCHKPNIGAEILLPDVSWTCRLCVFAMGTKEGGADKNGSWAKQLKQMKMELPYTLETLRWDDKHQRNMEGLYCYCGGPGEYYKKMLQCEKCLQWFHEGCIQVLDTPILYGDHYFTFNCAICNHGKESAKRIIMKWPDVVSLVLNNLELQKGQKFFDLYEEIIPFFKNNCHSLKLSEDMSKLKDKEIAERFEMTLSNFLSQRFMVPNESKKKKSSMTVWGLIKDPPLLFAPPNALNNSPPKIQLMKNNCSSGSASGDSGLSSSNSSHSSPSSKSNNLPLIFGACRKGASSWPSPSNKALMRQQIQAQPVSGNKKRLYNKVRSNSISSASAASVQSSSTGCAGSNKSSDMNGKLNNVKQLNNLKSNITKNTKQIMSKSGKIIADDKSGKIVKKMKRNNKTVVNTVSAKLIDPSSTNSEISDDMELSSCTIESLEVAIPVPDNFNGPNNPFVKDENEMIKNCLAMVAKRRKEMELEMCVKEEKIKHEMDIKPNLNSIKEEMKEKDVKTLKSDLNTSRSDLPSPEENVNILARRIKTDGTVEFLLEWDSKS